MSPEDADHNATIERIKKELDGLFAAQSEVLRDAVYLPMSCEAAKRNDERLEQNKKLVSQLATLSEKH